MYGLRAIEKACKDFEIPIEYGFKKRIMYLENAIQRIQTLTKQYLKVMLWQNTDTKDFILNCLKDINKNITNYQKQIINIKNYDKIENSITPEMIENAKNYPIENIIEVKRGMALCPNHSENTPSLDCRNNFAYCYGCGWKADTIGLYQKINKCSFIQAVKNLQ